MHTHYTYWSALFSQWMISLTQMERLSEFAPTLEVHMLYMCMQIMSRSALHMYADNV